MLQQLRGYHYYRRFWKPEEKQKLNCMHELNNPYDRFAIKLVTLNSETVGHLPKSYRTLPNFTLIVEHQCMLNSLQNTSEGHYWFRLEWK